MQKKQNYLWFVVLLACVGNACRSSDQMNRKLMGVYLMGDYPTGFRSLFFHDSTRTILDGKARPVQIGFWYPTDKGNRNEHMTFRDYFLLSAEEKGTQEFDSDSLITNYKKMAVQFGVSSDGIDSLFQFTFMAQRQAPVRDGKFPLILVAQGNYQTIFHQSVLCEYLASQGFYVVTAPHPVRISGQYSDYEGLVMKAHEQADDLDFARQKILSVIQKPDLPVGIIGYSFGARSALLYAIDHPDLKALVSLDGGIGNKMGKEWITYVDDFDPKKIKVPILHIYQPGDEVVQPDFSLIKSLNCRTKEFVKIDSVNHEFFMIMGAADGAIPGFMASPYPKAQKKYQELLDQTAKFLKHYIN